MRNTQVHIFDPTLLPSQLAYVNSLEGPRLKLHKYGLGAINGDLDLKPSSSMGKGQYRIPVTMGSRVHA